MQFFHLSLQINGFASLNQQNTIDPFRNLQEALGTYCDLEASERTQPPQMTLLADSTLVAHANSPEPVLLAANEALPPLTRFTKLWRLQNSGMSFTLVFFIFIHVFCSHYGILNRDLILVSMYTITL